MKNKMEITGIILAGGKSSRMGTDKGVLHVDGRAMVERIIETLSSATSRIIIIANNNNYDSFGYPVKQDLIKDCGPMGGIYTGLKFSSTPLNIIMSCDIPFVEADTLKQLAESPAQYEVVVPVHEGKTEPLCARYHQKCIPAFAGLLRKGEFKLQEALPGFKTLELQFAEDVKMQFANINTKEELNKFNTVTYEC